MLAATLALSTLLSADAVGSVGLSAGYVAVDGLREASADGGVSLRAGYGSESGWMPELQATLWRVPKNDRFAPGLWLGARYRLELLGWLRPQAALHVGNLPTEELSGAQVEASLALLLASGTAIGAGGSLWLMHGDALNTSGTSIDAFVTFDL